MIATKRLYEKKSKEKIKLTENQAVKALILNDTKRKWDHLEF